MDAKQQFLDECCYMGVIPPNIESIIIYDDAWQYNLENEDVVFGSTPKDAAMKWAAQQLMALDEDYRDLLNSVL